MISFIQYKLFVCMLNRWEPRRLETSVNVLTGTLCLIEVVQQFQLNVLGYAIRPMCTPQQYHPNLV